MRVIPRTTKTIREKASIDKGKIANATFKVRDFATTKRVVVPTKGWIRYPASVIALEDQNGVVPHALLFQRVCDIFHPLVQQLHKSIHARTAFLLRVIGHRLWRE